MDFDFGVEGIEDLEKALADLDVKVRVTAMRKALHAAGVPVREAVIERAPTKDEVGGKLPVGAMKADVRLRVIQADGQLMAVVDFGPMTYYVARWVEYGHRLVRGGYSSIKRGKLRGQGHQVGDVPAHPFIRPGFEASTQASFEAFVEQLRVELGKKD